MKRFKKTITTDRTVEKEEAKKRIDKLDPNNNINLPGKPVVKRRGKKLHDDGFEHRTSAETATLPLNKAQ
jgi:hypothetical protein